MEEKSGIDLLKRLVKELTEFGITANDKLKDGFQLMDIISLVTEGKDLAFVFTNWTAIKAEFEDLNEDEIKQLVDELVSDLKLSDVEVVTLIDKSIAFADAGYQLFKAIRALKE
jgi:hypothetical protein